MGWSRAGIEPADYKLNNAGIEPASIRIIEPRPSPTRLIHPFGGAYRRYISSCDVSGEEVQVRLLRVSSFSRWLLIQKYILNSYAKDLFVNFVNGQ